MKKQAQRGMVLIIMLMIASLGAIDGSAQRPMIHFKSRVGEKAPIIKSKSVFNEQVDTSVSNGKVVVLNFWFIACGPCRAEMPRLNELVKKYKDKDVQFLGVGFDDSDAIKKFLRKNAFDYKQIPNGTQILKDFGLAGIAPQHIVIDQTGLITEHLVGNQSLMPLEKSIEKLVSR